MPVPYALNLSNGIEQDMIRRNRKPASGRSADSPPENVAILQLGKLGDMILTTPLFNALKKLYPGTRTTVIAAEASALVPLYLSAVDEVIAVPRGFRQYPTLAARLRSDRFDLYIDLKNHRSTTSRLIAEMVRAERAIVHKSNMAHRTSEQELPPPAPPGHYVDMALAPMAVLAPGRSFRRLPSVIIPQDAYHAVDSQIDPGEYGLVTVNISAGHPSRYWKPEKWTELIGKLSQRFSVAVLSSPGDRSLADEICTMRKRARPIRTETILEAAAVVERSLAVVSPDTSIIHLASALERPCVGLYPPIDSNARTFAPLSEPHIVLMPEPDKTIADIATDDVLNATRRVIT